MGNILDSMKSVWKLQITDTNMTRIYGLNGATVNQTSSKGSLIGWFSWRVNKEESHGLRTKANWNSNT